jgi:hypothetical protein
MVVIKLEYSGLCQKILESDPNIRDVFLVSSGARLVAFCGAEDAIGIDEAQLAELMEDLLFMTSSRRHYEDLFGAFQYIRIKHKRSDTFVLPFETDKVLCVCLRTTEYDEAKLVRKLQDMASIYKYA